MNYRFKSLTCMSLKSWSCMAVEKSSKMWVKLGHLLANSWRTVWVMSSIGSSKYRRDAPNLELKIPSVWPALHHFQVNELTWWGSSETRVKKHGGQILRGEVRLVSRVACHRRPDAISYKLEPSDTLLDEEDKKRLEAKLCQATYQWSKISKN